MVMVPRVATGPPSNPTAQYVLEVTAAGYGDRQALVYLRPDHSRLVTIVLTAVEDATPQALAG